MKNNLKIQFTLKDTLKISKRSLRPDLSGALFLCSKAEQKKAGTEGGNRRPNNLKNPKSPFLCKNCNL